MDLTLRALNRFGMGARIGEASRISDPRQWLRQQLVAPPPSVDGGPPVTPEEIGAAIRAQRMVLGATQEERQQARRRLLQIAQAEERALLRTRATSERPFVERLVAFWSNHLAISTAGKPALGPLAGSYEREAIRPHVLGRFEEMLLASATHPAMLVYLDNFQSIGPRSPGARGPARPATGRGLNENYARELLELHTLGVDGGYSQQDVQELAKILTGWTVSGFPGAPGAGTLRARSLVQSSAGAIGFSFVPTLHEPGPKTLLGRRHPERGVAEGEAALRDLAAHPSTAAFLARKLAAHFIADDPPVAAVETLTRAFRDSQGDLRQVALALVDLDEPWAPENRKLRSPQDWLTAALRAVGAPQAAEGAGTFLRPLRQPLWAPPSPAGYGDRAREWSDPDSLLNRAELARTLGTRLSRSRIDPAGLVEVMDVPPGDPLRSLLADRTIAPAERIALALAGPAFQWR